MLQDQILKLLDASICDSDNTFRGVSKRLEEGNFTREENSGSHFCAYFLPYNSKTKQVFIVHHKKSGLWLAPGGHIDKDESLLETLNREIEEELGVKNNFAALPQPFLFSITPIENKAHACKTHYDIWFLMQTDGANFNIDPREFHDTKWLIIKEAKKMVTDPPNLKALEIIASNRF